MRAGETLLDNRTNVAAVDETTGHSVLHVAVKAGKLTYVRMLLRREASVDAVDKVGNTPLHLAATGSSVDILTALLDAGSALRLKNKAGQVAEDLAIAAGKKKIVSAFAPYNQYVLLQACKMQAQDAFDEMLARKVEVNCVDGWGDTPLHFAAIHGATPMVRQLLDAGAKVTIRDEYGQSALEVAEMEGHVETAELLRTTVSERKAAAPTGLATKLKRGFLVRTL